MVFTTCHLFEEFWRFLPYLTTDQLQEISHSHTAVRWARRLSHVSHRFQHSTITMYWFMEDRGHGHGRYLRRARGTMLSVLNYHLFKGFESKLSQATFSEFDYFIDSKMTKVTLNIVHFSSYLVIMWTILIRVVHPVNSAADCIAVTQTNSHVEPDLNTNCISNRYNYHPMFLSGRMKSHYINCYKQENQHLKGLCFKHEL